MKPTPTLDFRTVNTLWASVVVESLVRCGLRQVVISPGSRSTPLTLAFAAHSAVEAIPVLDERSAAFFALGLAKQHERPTALICTSGTAGANYFPAIIEAQEGGVPLLVITADRPPEMRECASGQTIDQQKLFGSHVNFYHELAVPEALPKMLGYLRQTVAHAYARALGPLAGPVHLNAPFRDPLAPPRGGAANDFAGMLAWPDFFDGIGPSAPVEIVSPLPNFPVAVHGVIVVGPTQTVDPAGFAATVGLIARKLGWPVLADGLSPLRHHALPGINLVTTYDVLLRNPAVAERLRPERVLCLGGWPISKVLRAWLEESGAPILLVSEGAANRDALHGRTQHLRCSLPFLAEQLPAANDVNGYAQVWPALERKARAALDHSVLASPGMFEGRIVPWLARHLPEGTPLFLANSMPVRDAEYFWPPNDRKIQPHFSRGANGIDGTLSTALGVAHGNRPSVLFTGDLALLHDTNGFLVSSRLRGSLTIVLVNNRGGGIFEHLPVAAIEPPFEEFFATPQAADFEKLCAAYGVAHVMIRDWDHFADMIATLPEAGVRVLEVRTDRKKDAAMRKAIFAEVSGAL
ncbi:MAG: 2-succinyl-6-hydroxy-2,4-cyclohexadiene-carboxylic acid synthase/2-oxoglutarate decarboxylase [Verrucomicrobia bacterium]|nr:2-succinyl-6-hydroxy-2,4-cyclohexadiene-carboxylic acid synthase/2-oxoglutarate decarboxylase [Verrucomicrobiota bacterium]